MGDILQHTKVLVTLDSSFLLPKDCVWFIQWRWVHMWIDHAAALKTVKKLLCAVETGFLFFTLKDWYPCSGLCICVCLCACHMYICVCRFSIQDQCSPVGIIWLICPSGTKSQLLTILWNIACAKVSLLFNHQWRQIQEVDDDMEARSNFLVP